MSALFTRWPAWYLLVVAYTAWIGISELRRQAQCSAAFRAAVAAAAVGPERAQLQGQRVGRWARAALGLVGALLLLGGWTWAQGLVALGYAVSMRRSVRDFAIGCAEGRRSAELAAALEYVQGRVAPRATDYLLANCYAVVTRGLPLVAVLYALTELPR